MGRGKWACLAACWADGIGRRWGLPHKLENCENCSPPSPGDPGGPQLPGATVLQSCFPSCPSLVLTGLHFWLLASTETLSQSAALFLMLCCTGEINCNIFRIVH